MKTERWTWEAADGNLMDWSQELVREWHWPNARRIWSEPEHIPDILDGSPDVQLEI